MRLQQTMVVVVVGLQAACTSSGGASPEGGPQTDATDQDAEGAGNESGGGTATDAVAGGDSSGDTGSSRCSPPQSVWTCPIAAGGQCVVPGAENSGCIAGAVPEGLPCGAVQQCSLPILSCPGELEAGLGNGPVDGYVCTCVAGRWSCQDCFPNDGPCTNAGLSTDAGTGPETDGGRGDAGFATILLLGRSNLCLPQPLPTAASGESTCSVLVVGLRESCAAAGLAPATAQELAAVVAEAMKTGGLLPGSICELGQVAASTSGPGCSDPQSTSWCYAHGSCLGDAGTPCAEAICTTAAFQAGYIPALPPDAAAQGFSWGSYLLCP